MIYRNDHVSVQDSRILEDFVDGVGRVAPIPFWQKNYRIYKETDWSFLFISAKLKLYIPKVNDLFCAADVRCN